MPNLFSVRFLNPVVALLSLLLLPPSAAADASPPSVRVWRQVTTPSRGQPLVAVAVDRVGNRVAVADPAGVSVARVASDQPTRFERVVRVPGARDLVFDDTGSLWIAAENGLWRRSPDGRLSEVAALPGVAAREIRRVATRGVFTAVATGSGLLLSADGERWGGVGGVLATTPVIAIAFGPIDAARPASEAQAVLWALAGSDLWRIEVVLNDGQLETRPYKLNAVASRPTSEPPIDVWAGSAGEVAILYPAALAFLAPGTSIEADPDLDPDWETAWRVVWPTLPPGAVALRLGYADERFWIVHDRGLSWSATPDGQWRRAATPAGSSAARQLANGAGRLWLATADGLLMAHTSWQPSRSNTSRRVSTGWTSGDPSIEQVHRAVLREQNLGPDRMAALHRRLRFRGWLPTLSLRFAVEDQSDWSREDDQAYITGGKRFLQDHDQGGGRDYEGSASLSWDFGDAAFEPETIDLAREERQWIGLRDDVLDEVNQLYFERQGLLRRLGQLGGPESPEGDEETEILQRASELGAGLDGWTGGWFSTASRATASPAPP